MDFIRSEKVDITFISVNEDILKKIKISKNISLAAYYRLLVHLFFPKKINKIIYLDSDLIVNEDIGKLLELDIKNNYPLAVQEQDSYSKYVSSPSGILNYKQLGLNPKNKFFNSCVLEINLDKWRLKNIGVKTINYIKNNKKYIRLWDQKGINFVLANKIGKLDLRWNLLAQIFWYPWKKKSLQ